MTIRRIALISLAVLAAAGCSLTPQERKWVAIGTGVLIVGAIAAHDADSGKPISPTVPTPHVDCATAPDFCR